MWQLFFENLAQLIKIILKFQSFLNVLSKNKNKNSLKKTLDPIGFSFKVYGFSNWVELKIKNKKKHGTQ